MLGKDCPKYLNDDTECVMRAQKGEEDALRILCERYNLSVYQYVRWKIKDFDNAKDITSCVFIKVIDKIDDLKDAGQFKNWLYTIVDNQIRDFIRSRAREPDRIEDDIPDETIDTEKISHTSSGSPLSLNVASVMKKLDPVEKLVLYLSYFKDMNYPEIAAHLGKTENNVRLIMHRARKNFQRLYLQKFKSPVYSGGEKNEEK